jgi:hypothetical protein
LLKGGRGMEDNMKEFIAYSRKLLRSLTKLKKLLDDAEYDEAKQMLDELIEDTQKDIEA